MSSHRIDRINEEIKRELVTVLRGIKDPRVPEMISVVDVKTTPDLKFCKAYVSFLDGVDEKEAMLGLKAAARYIRKQVGMAVKLRNLPEFSFVCDHSIKEGARISRIIKEVMENGAGDTNT